MQWWCAARSASWTWTWQAYPGVWLLVLALAVAYWLVSRRWALTLQPDSSTVRGRPGWFAAGLICLWISLDWPVGALGAGYLASVHMLQFILIAVVVPPLLMLGVPAGHPNLPAGPEKWLRLSTHPLIALVFFNVVIIITHLPSIVDALMTTQLGSFAIDMAWLAGGVAFWWPVLIDRPERPGFGYPLKIGYLILATIVNAGTFLYLTFSELPVYATYELAPPLYGISPLDDQRVAGLLMKVGTAAVLWAAIGIFFYLWHRAEAEQT
jgi:putative membrane protein